MTREHALFVLMCLVWGLTWIAIKTGVAAVPPFFFAALRLVSAGGLLLAFALAQGRRPSFGGAPARALASAVLVNTAAYGALFWAMQHVPSGLSAIVNLSLIPVGLFGIGLLAREETFSARKVVAIGLGIVGLGVLFAPELRAPAGTARLSGMAAIVFGTLAYCWGSILSRPLLRRLDAVRLGGLQGIVGGAGLLLLSLAFEPVDAGTLLAFVDPPLLASWAFLVLGGSIAGFTIYLTLLRDWGPARAGLYAFVSPVIAVAVGVAFFSEPFGALEGLGSAILLAASSVAMRGGAASAKVDRVPEEGTRLQPAEGRLTVALDEREKP